MRSCRCVVGTLTVVLLAGAGSSAMAQATFQGLGDLPSGAVSSYGRGLSADGSVVVGYSGSAAGDEAFRWTQAGMVGLGYLPGGDSFSQAYSISADALFIVGVSDGTPYHGDTQAFRWSQATGMVGLGAMPGGNWSTATGVSGDGSVVVGYGNSSNTSSDHEEAFYWTAETGMVGLGDFPGGDFWSWAQGVTPDGSVIVGASKHDQGWEAFRWTAETGMVGLGDLPGDIFYSAPYDITPDGSAIVGMSCGEGTSAYYGYRAFLWMDAIGMVDLGSLVTEPNEYAPQSHAYGISADGSIIVGKSNTDGAGTVAFIWDYDHAMRQLQTVLVDEYGLGPQLTGWTLGTAYDISDDGLTIVGDGINPTGEAEAWIVCLDAGIPGDLNGDGDVDLDDYAILAECLNGPENPPAGTCPPGADADLDGDGDVDLRDFATFTQEFTGSQ